jgi:hypothetical protein
MSPVRIRKGLGAKKPAVQSARPYACADARRSHGPWFGGGADHAAAATQLDWCQEAHVRQAVFTHCGSQVVGGDARRLNAVLRRLGHERDVDAPSGLRWIPTPSHKRRPATTRSRLGREQDWVVLHFHCEDDGEA